MGRQAPPCPVGLPRMVWVRFRENSPPELQCLIEAVPVEVGEEISRSITSHSAELRQPGTFAGRGSPVLEGGVRRGRPLIHGLQTFLQPGKAPPG